MASNPTIQAVVVAGVWYDGSSTRGTQVVLRRSPNAAVTLEETQVHGSDAVAPWPVTIEQITPRIGDTTRAISFGDGSRMESGDHDALERLERSLGLGRGHRTIHLMESRWRFAIAAGVLLLAGGWVTMRWGLPWAAERAAMAMPDSVALQVGKGTLKVLDATILKPTKLSKPRQAELRDSFARMAQRYEHLPLTLYFRRGIGPNAFALPDGTVLLTDELESLATHDAQLMAVLAHEIGHVHHRHGLRMALESATVAVLLSVVAGDVADVGAVAAGMPTAVVQAHYSRDHERQADDFALEHMQHAGVEPRHFADVMELLQEAVGGQKSEVSAYLASHPPTQERIGRFRGAGGP